MAWTSIDSPVREGDVIDGKYVVDQVIGAGGMGVVVAARHAELGQRVALKFLLPQALGIPGAVERFIREARSAVQLQSQHVARVYDVGRVEGGTPYLVMELLQGCDLGSLVKDNGPLRVGDVAEYLIQACEAVAEAHALGIVHRDLKPANLFLTRRVNGAPLVKVLDFGISKVINLRTTDPSLTKTSDVVGSPYYMAPEQVRSARDVDARTDIWALGVILYELISGEVPFKATNVPQLCAMVLEAEPVPLIQARPDVPEALSQIVSTCLRKLPEQRYACVQDLVRALAPFAGMGADAGYRSGLRMPGANGVVELPPLPERSSMTLGETMQQHTFGPLRSAPPLGCSNPTEMAGENAQPTLNNTGQPYEAQSRQQSVSSPGRNTALTWNREAGRQPMRRSWLLVAVPIVGLLAGLAVAASIWMIGSEAEVESDPASIASGAPSLADTAIDAESTPAIPEQPATTTTSSAPLPLKTSESESAPKRTAPTVTKSVPPAATETAAPAATGASVGDDFLPSDRK